MHKLKGFTLIELMITLSIAGVMLMIGVPSFQAYLLNNRQTASVNSLAGALQLARNNAISRRVTVTLCKSNDGAACAVGAGSGDWSQGWIVFTDTNGNNARDAEDVLLRVHGVLPGNVTLIGNRLVDEAISFSPQGLARGSEGTLVYCDSRGKQQAKGLVISSGGRVRQAQDTDNNGVIEFGAGGDNVTC